MKWKSKATGNVYHVEDAWSGREHKIAIFARRDIDNLSWSPDAYITYLELVEAFEKVEE